MIIDRIIEGESLRKRGPSQQGGAIPASPLYTVTTGRLLGAQQEPASRQRRGRAAASDEFARILRVTGLGLPALVNSREVRKKSAAQVFVEPVNRALPSQIGRCFVVAFWRRVTVETVNSVWIYPSCGTLIAVKALSYAGHVAASRVSSSP